MQQLDYNVIYTQKVAQNMNILVKNRKTIINLSQKYINDNLKFAQRLYKLIITKKGYADAAPDLELVPLDELKNERTRSEFSFYGKICLAKNIKMTHDDIVEALFHELEHFEQYMLFAKTSDLGGDFLTQNHILRAMDTVLGGIKNLKKLRSKKSDESQTNDLFIQTRNNIMNNFYRRVVSSDYIPRIGKNHEMYEYAHELAKSYENLYKEGDYEGYIEPMYEKLAHAVGKSARNTFKTLLNENNYEQELSQQLISER